jgi:hypothetical protein
MARYTLTLALPAGFAKATAADLSSALGQALLELGAEVVKCSRWQLVADDVSNAEEPIRMIFCWSQPTNAAQAVEVGVELISRELMGSGSPRTQGAIDRLLKGLSEQVPGLRVLSDSRSPVAKLATSTATAVQEQQN